MSPKHSAEVTQKTSNVLSGGLLDDIRPRNAALPETTKDTDEDNHDDEEKRKGLAPIQEGFEDYVDWDDGDDDGQVPRVPKDVMTPSAEDIEAHNATHIPYKSWCPACVEGKKSNPPHRRVVEEGRTVPELAIDYAFMRDSEDADRLTIVIMKDRDSKAVFSDMVEVKGQGISGTIQRIADNISRLGYKKVILKSDQEPALIDLINGIIEYRDDPTIPEHSPVGESQSNGLVERAVRSCKDQIRTSKLALEKRINSRVQPSHPAMAWIIQHAGDTISKYQLGKDSTTSYERLMGKPCKEQVVEFGERVYYKTGPTEDLEPRWSTGTWLGKRWASGEHFIHIGPEVIKCRAIHRVPLEDRWHKSNLESVVAMPWKLKPSPQDSADNVRVMPPLPQDETSMAPPQPRQPDVRAPLRPRITKSDLSRWGFTDGCLRCRQLRNGQAEDGSTHREKSRRRIENEMRREADPRVKQSEDKHIACQEHAQGIRSY